MTAIYSSYAKPGSKFGAPAQVSPYGTPAYKAWLKRFSSPTGASTPVGAPAPAPPAAPADSALPTDPAYDAQLAGLQRQRDSTISALQGQRTASLLNYGYNEGPNGALTFDPNNAFSQASQLKKRYDESRSTTGINMASRGQLYSGSYQNSQDAQNRAQLQSEDTLQKQVLAYLAANTAQQTQAGTDYLTGSGQAEGDRLNRVASNPLYTPGADTSTPPQQPAAAAPSAPTVKAPSKSKGIPAKYRGRLGVGAKPRRK